MYVNYWENRESERARSDEKMMGSVCATRVIYDYISAPIPVKLIMMFHQQGQLSIPKKKSYFGPD